jgi:hypothetical protein
MYTHCGRPERPLGSKPSTRQRPFSKLQRPYKNHTQSPFSPAPIPTLSSQSNSPQPTTDEPQTQRIFGSQRRLCLVLDLDHTLLNSALFTHVDPGLHAWLEARAADAQARPPEERLIFKLEGIKVESILLAICAARRTDA